MKKIVILTNHSYMLYRFRRELIEELMKNNEVVLGMPFVGHEDDFQKMGLRCIEIPLERRSINPMAEMKLINTYRKLLKKEKPDMVITYSIKPNIYAGLVCAIKKIPYCANVQGLGAAFQNKKLAMVATFLYKTALRKAKTVFFENEANASEFVNSKILPKARIKVLPGAGINLEEYPLTTYPENEKVHFLYLGRIMKDKGVEELFEAMRRLHAEFGSKVVLDLVGFFDDNYEEQVNQLVADGAAVFHGFQTDPRPFYAASDCVVLPSYHEGLSNVLLEAAAMGRPVITSDIPGCQETVDADQTGLLVPVKNVDKLYDAMKKLYQMSKNDRELMGQRANEKIQREFDKNTVVKLTCKALKL